MINQNNDYECEVLKAIISKRLLSHGWKALSGSALCSKTIITTFGNRMAYAYFHFCRDEGLCHKMNGSYVSAGQDVLAATYACFPKGCPTEVLNETVDDFARKADKAVAESYAGKLFLLRMTEACEYRFKVSRPAKACGGTTDNGQTFVLTLTQEEFEDYQLLKSRVHTAIKEMGISMSASERPYWRECPEVSSEFEEKIRAAIGASAEAQFIAYHPHSWHHRHYQFAFVDGVNVLYQCFENDLIKWAPSIDTTRRDLDKIRAVPKSSIENMASTH